MPSSSLTILFLGATGTGKSSLIKRMAAKPISEGYIPTIGYSIEKTSIIKQATQYHLTLVEVAGSPLELQSLQKPLLSEYKFDLVILVYDVGDKASKQEIYKYLKELEDINGIGNLRYFVIANKLDTTVIKQDDDYPYQNIEYLSALDYSLDIGEICQKIWDKARYFNVKTISKFQSSLYQTKTKEFQIAIPTTIRKIVGGFPQYHKTIKLIFLGSSNSGKSNITAQFNDKQLNDDYIPTIGVDFNLMPILYKDHIYNLQIWDTSGHMFKNITLNFVKTSDIFFFVYDISDKSSLQYLYCYYEEIKQLLPTSRYILSALIGNKCDKQRSVTYQEGQLFAKSKGMDFFQISAKTKQGLLQSVIITLESYLNYINKVE